MRNASLFLLLLILLFPLRVYGQNLSGDETIIIAGMTMRRGMSEGEIVRELEKKGYKLIKLEDYHYMIFELGKGTVGSLTFENGKLFQATRDWGTFEGSGAMDVGMALYSVLANVFEEGKYLAQLEVKTSRQPDLQVHTITLKFLSSKRELRIFVSDGKVTVEGQQHQVHQVEINESLQFKK